MSRFALIALLMLAPAARAGNEVAELAKKLDALRQPLLNDSKKPGPFPAEIVGKVKAYKDGSVNLNIGIDAGLENGMTTDIYRDKRLLGTLVIERVLPKECVAKFTPAGGKKLNELKADELPKEFDAAGPYKAK